MQIPHEVTARPDTGLYNAKLGIWLFLASEVMLFGGLFSAYVFMRMGAEPGYWPHGLLNVPVGTANTAILIASSVTVVLAWASLKMRRWNQYLLYMGITIACGATFLAVKLCYEWPQKFEHFGVFIRRDSLPTYEPYLGNDRLKKLEREQRVEISGHLHEAVIAIDGVKHTWEISSASELQEKIEQTIEPQRQALEKKLKDELEAQLKQDRTKLEHIAPADRPAIEGSFKEELERAHVLTEKSPKLDRDLRPEEIDRVMERHRELGNESVEERVRSWSPKIETEEIKLKLDALNANPDSPENDRPHFWPRPLSDKLVTIEGKDIESSSAFYPRHSTYFSTYFLITGLHGLHVFAGILVFAYFFFFGKQLYLRNPEHMANRVEVAGLFWHFVDLVWIFVFPIFYLL